MSNVVRYVRSVWRWLREGRPVRSDEAVHWIYEYHCRPCRYMSDGRCRRCGCQVQGATDGLHGFWVRLHRNPALVNKIRMATEHCPARKW